LQKWKDECLGLQPVESRSTISLDGTILNFAPFENILDTHFSVSLPELFEQCDFASYSAFIEYMVTDTSLRNFQIREWSIDDDSPWTPAKNAKSVKYQDLTLNHKAGIKYVFISDGPSCLVF
jgi:hypothetical protein